MRLRTIFGTMLLLGLLVAGARAQSVNLERSFPYFVFLLTQDKVLGDHLTNLDKAGGVDALVQQAQAGYDIVDIGTGQTIAALRRGDLFQYFGEGAWFSVLGFADLDNDGNREVILYSQLSEPLPGATRILAFDPRTSRVTLNITGADPTYGYQVGAIGDLDGDGADEILVWVTGDGHLISCDIYGSGPSSPVSGSGAPAADLRSLRLWPNPSRRAIQIAFEMPGDDALSVRIFDVSGRLVRELHPPKGSRGIQWDGLDSEGRLLAAGVYFCETSSPTGTLSRKLVRVD